MELEAGREVMPPCKAAVAITSQSCWARVGVVDMGRMPVDNDVQADATVCYFDDVDHEEEVIAAFLVYVYGLSALCLCLEIP
jgi:hypothetical protein